MMYKSTVRGWKFNAQFLNCSLKNLESHVISLKNAWGCCTLSLESLATKTREFRRSTWSIHINICCFLRIWCWFCQCHKLRSGGIWSHIFMLPFQDVEWCKMHALSAAITLEVYHWQCKLRFWKIGKQREGGGGRRRNRERKEMEENIYVRGDPDIRQTHFTK